MDADTLHIAQMMFLYAEDLGNAAIYKLAKKFHRNGYLYDDEFDVLLPALKKCAKHLKGKKMVPYDASFHPLLRQYQREGVSFLEAIGRGLLADDMGLGKTAQALCYLDRNAAACPALVVCPAALKYNWQAEIAKWTGLTCRVMEGGVADPQLLKNVDVVIVNYDIIPERTEKIEKNGKLKRVKIKGTGWIGSLLKFPFASLILDEAHYIKSPKTARSKSCRRLSKSIKRFIAITGTPVLNRPVELQPILASIDAGTWGDRWSFVMRYCNAKKNRYGWDFTGASNIKELHDKLVPGVMLRRLKSEVLSQLPPKNRSIVPIYIDNMKKYQTIKNNFLKWVEDELGSEKLIKAKRAQTLVQMNFLTQAAVDGKMKAALKWIEDYLDSGNKLVVFAIHKKVIDQVMKKFKKIAVKVDGSVTGAKRQAAVDKFQTDKKTLLFVGNIDAAGVGLTLTAAQDTCFLEIPWSPGGLSQAEDRVHRIGQKGSVMAYYLMAHNTIEYQKAEYLTDKIHIIRGLVDGANSDDVDFDLVGSLLEGI